MTGKKELEMDNDHILLQWARDRYKELRFGWTYRGIEVEDAKAGNDRVMRALQEGKPFLFGRCGATEMRTVAEYYKNGGTAFGETIRAEVRNLSGVFPNDDETLRAFCECYIHAAHAADLLALWDVGAERRVVQGCRNTAFTRLRALEPYYHTTPWSAALAGKRVLVVHPFKASIEAQYQKREQLFPGTDILPQFASLTVVPAVQGLAGQKTGYPNWFAALDAMQAQMDAVEYDVALIGAGAYGLPLAAHARGTGHIAIQMGGATQILFGIRGKRWDAHPVISKLYNDAWTRPLPEEQPQNKEVVEGGSYW